MVRPRWATRALTRVSPARQYTSATHRDPRTRTVLAYRSLTDVREFSEGDRIPGDDVLPEFEAPVAAFFAEWRPAMPLRAGLDFTSAP